MSIFFLIKASYSWRKSYGITELIFNIVELILGPTLNRENYYIDTRSYLEYATAYANNRDRYIHIPCNNWNLGKRNGTFDPIITERHSIPRLRREQNCNRCLSSGQVTHVPQERYLTGEQTAGVIVYLILLSHSKTAALRSLTRRDTAGGVCVKVSPLLNSRFFLCVLGTSFLRFSLGL